MKNMDEYVSVVGNNIRERRKLIGKTQEDIAKKMGVSKSQISKWENENSFPSMSNFTRLCEELNIKPEALLAGKINEDHIENKEQKEKRQKNIVIILCVLVGILCVILIFECYLKFFPLSDSERFKREILYIQKKEDLSWKIRQIVQDGDGKLWVDVLMYQEDNQIIGAEILEVIAPDEVKNIVCKMGINEGKSKVSIYIFYDESGTRYTTYVEVNYCNVN